jgi:hypothetical protein
MDRFNDSGRRPRPSSGRRRVLRAVVGSLLIAAGVILRFVITASFLPALKLHDVGVVLLLVGVGALLLVPASARGDWLRTRWVSPGQPQPYRGPGAARSRYAQDYRDGPVAAEDPPAFEFDPPPES